MAFLDHLVQKGVLASGEARKIAKESEETGNDPVDILVGKGMDKGQLMTMKSEYTKVPYKPIEAGAIPLDILKYIPEESATHYRLVPIGLEDGVLEVGIVDPDNIEARDALQFISSKLNVPYKVFLISQDDFEALMENYRSLSGEVHKALSDLESELTDGGAEKSSERRGGAKSKQGEGVIDLKIVEDTPITKIVAVMLRHAVEGGASDIHIEPTAEHVKVRFRVDGVLKTSLVLPTNVLNSVVARVKVLSGLRLDERRKPQDGSFSARIENRKIDFRVSSLPTYYGEKVVLRILDAGMGVKKLDETGLREDDIAKIRRALAKPFGLVLLTGPTGSGKTTTLYAMLNELDRERNNVVSLEDPVEYVIEGVNQSQVRPEINYTFATGLRSILRQDPDIVMVGEIRDKETAQLAIQAALTGHLVFSTLHTNNAAGVVPRLVDMGIDPYLIAPTLMLAIAQRLVQVLCPSKKKVPVEGALQKMIERQFEHIPPEFRKTLPPLSAVYEAEPSEECPAGTRGRIGVFEIIEIDKDMERIILERPDEQEITKAARQKGMLSMKDDALIKALEGTIPFREVNRFE
ncbi:MAG: type II/IV secretion system protein [Parcubacteria group bacterium]|nr:type II/IV secretion system protein [Parcubacteria group bacterium]